MAKTKFDHRQATPHATFGYTDRGGSQRELVADKDGVVKPQTAQDVEVLMGFGLPAVVTPDDEPKAKADRKAIEAEFKTTDAGLVPRDPDDAATRVTDDDTSKPAETGAEG